MPIKPATCCRFLCVLTLLGAGLLPPAATGDQTDPRLDTLFERIRTVEDPRAAEQIEHRIWVIWADGNDAEVNRLMERGVEAMAANRLERAIALFTEIIEKSPGFAEGWNKRATAYYLSGDMSASVHDIERTLALEPRHFGAVSGLGLIFLDRGDKIGALEAFKRVLEINPHARGARAHVRLLKEALKDQGA